RSGEGGIGIALGRLLLDRGNRELAGLDRCLERLGLGARGDVELVGSLPVDRIEPCLEALALLVEARPDAPVFLWLEALDLGLAVAHQPEGYRLHAARRTRARQLP